MAWAIVTGATSGIGEAVSWKLARLRRWELLLVSRRDDRLRAVASTLREACNVTAEHLSLDLAAGEMGPLRQWLVEHAKVEVLVNSAGVGFFGPTTEMSAERVAAVISTNVIGLYSTSQLIIENMKHVDGVKTIVNISSDAESIGFPDASIYSASKGGVAALSRAWQTELRQYRIRVSNIAPGRVDTHFNGKKPGMRPGALTADEVADVVGFVVSCPSNIELRKIEVDSLGRLA